MAKRRGSSGGPLSRIAFYKAKPVNRDALRGLGFKSEKGKDKTASGVTIKKAVRPNSPTSKPKKLLVTAAEEAERKAKARRMFGLGAKVRAVAPKRSSERPGKPARPASGVRHTARSAHSPCPRCGSSKSQYYACFKCGFSFLTAENQGEKKPSLARAERGAGNPVEKPGKPAKTSLMAERLKEVLPELQTLRPKSEKLNGRVLVGTRAGSRKKT